MKTNTCDRCNKNMNPLDIFPSLEIYHLIFKGGTIRGDDTLKDTIMSWQMKEEKIIDLCKPCFKNFFDFAMNPKTKKAGSETSDTLLANKEYHIENNLQE